MKTFWKWLIGILAVLALLAAGAGLGAYQLYLRGSRMAASQPPDRAWQNPMPGRGAQGDSARPDLRAGERPYRQMLPMQRDRAAMPFMFTPFAMFGGLLRLLLPLAVLFGVGYLGYVLGRRSLPAVQPPPPPPAPPQPSAPAEAQIPPAA